MEKILNLILDEQKRQGDLLHQLINSVAVTNVKVTELDRKVTELDRKVVELDSKVAKLDCRVTELEGKVAEIDKKITEMDDKIIVMDKKLDSVFEEVKEIKATMATKHDLEYYDQMISEHSREIYKLKNH